jgi:hypothetical protein
MELAHALNQQKDSSQSVKKDGVFRKSSLSGGSGCVAVAKFTDNSVKIRDTKDKEGPVLSFTKQEWEAFLGGVKRGEFEI